ncbi:hypothetical protein [Maribacter halichondriae]|uniref:hypothetical protein n=1 Tax=Maribacter halichondriae TaxID=2980554 RepID=UPI0023590D33|nr:hypothetical protein [Maribacter sp. Hal144]
MLIFPWPLGKLPGFGVLEEFHSRFFEPLITWFGNDLLGIESKISNSVIISGDKLYDYLLLLFFIILALLGSFIWSFIEKRNRPYEKLNYIFEIILRYFLAYQMIYYGIFKIIPVQFFEPYFSTLLQSYGKASPMGIFWTMMAVSKGYALFAGLAEFIGGVFLFFRKTKLLGSLISIGVLINVVAVNFFYDIPVKLFSIELLIIAILLIVPYLSRLSKVILSNRAVEKIILPSYYDKGKWKTIRPFLKWGFVAIFCYTTLSTALKAYSFHREKEKTIPLYGLYEISTLITNNDSITTQVKYADTWRYLIIEHDNSAQILQTDMSKRAYEFEVDSIAKKFNMKNFRDSEDVYTFNYQKTDTTLTFSGIVKNDTLFYETKRIEKEDFLLMNRGFHWINEYPYNR